MAMFRYVIEDDRHVPPFNEPARLLTIGIRPLSFHHEEIFAESFTENLGLGRPLASRDEISTISDPAIVYRDSLWFDKEFLEYFIEKARATGKACRAAIAAADPAFSRYTLYLTDRFEPAKDADGHDIFLADLWFLPNGFEEQIIPVVVPSDAKEKGFYSVPDFMQQEQGDLTHFLAARAIVSIESWVHVYYASIILGAFSRGSRREEYVKTHNFFALKLLWRAILEQKQMLNTSAFVQVGKNTNIHPEATVIGPTVIGDNCYIGPGVVIDNCTIGDNVTIDQGCQLMVSTVANNCFLPFRASLYLTSVMESTIIAQNTCLQMCVIGRNSFIAAGSTFTDFKIIGKTVTGADGLTKTVPRPITAVNSDGDIESVDQVVLGGGVGHNCRIGSGMVIFPGRMIESDVVLIGSPQRRIVSRNVTFEESDHHYLPGGDQSHRRQYPRPDEKSVGEPTWDQW